MGELYNKILDPRNIYAAAYALPGFLKEKGLIGAVNKDDLVLYQKLKYAKYSIDDTIITDCKIELDRLLNKDKDDLFKVKLFFKFKKVKASRPEYRPIHTANISTLICLQAIANTIFYDDDYEKGVRRFSSLNTLIPTNFLGNTLTIKPEYI